MEGPDIEYIPDFIKEKEQKIITKILDGMKDEFISSEHFIFGKHAKSSVRYLWLSDTGLDYLFGKTMKYPLEARSFDEFPVLKCMREYVEAYTGHPFNSLLVNLYEDGTKGLDYHHDDDAWLGENFIVPSISLGARRNFVVKRKINLRGKPTKRSCTANPKPDDTEEPPYVYTLESGSMVLMGESVQKDWIHCVPKQTFELGSNRKRRTGRRYNFTFRHVFPELAHKMNKPVNVRKKNV